MWGYPEPRAVNKNADSSGSGADTAEVVTIAAIADERHVIKDVHWSYDDASTTGGLTIAVAGVTVFDVDIIRAAGDNDSFHFADGLSGGVNEAVVITLGAAGGSTAGKLNVNYA